MGYHDVIASLDEDLENPNLGWSGWCEWLDIGNVRILVGLTGEYLDLMGKRRGYAITQTFGMKTVDEAYTNESRREF